MSEKLSNAIVRSIDEQGYQKRPDGVFALCNIHPSGLTTAELVCAMYNHVTKGSLKSVEEIASELTKTELSYRKSLMVQNSGEVLNHISSIGDVIFDCDVYPHKINITEVERNYGSMEALVRGLWMERIKGIAALEAQGIKWEQF
jgi:hypothetical protein